MDFEKEVSMLLKKCDIRDKLKLLLGKEVTVYIDRPLGSKHPKFPNIIYPVNYGYIKEVKALDNDYQDAYLLGVTEPVETYIGVVYAIIVREDDVEDKLVIVPKNKEFTVDEIDKLVNFQEKYFKHKIMK